MFTQQKLHYEGYSKGKGQQPHMLPSSGDWQLMNKVAQLCHFLPGLIDEAKDKLAHIETPTHLDAFINFSLHRQLAV